MSVRLHDSSDEPNSSDEPRQTRVLEISDLPVSQIRGYAADTDDVYFERRGGRTFLVSDR